MAEENVEQSQKDDEQTKEEVRLGGKWHAVNEPGKPVSNLPQDVNFPNESPHHV